MTAPSGSVPEPAEGPWPEGHRWGHCLDALAHRPHETGRDGVGLGPSWCTGEELPTPPVPAPTEPKENTVSDDEACGGGVQHVPSGAGPDPFDDVCTTCGRRIVWQRTEQRWRSVAVTDPVPAPTVDLDAELAAVARAWDEALADDCWAEGLALRRVVSAARAELSVLRAREAQVRALAEPKPAKLGDQCRNCGDRRLHHRPGACDLCGFCGGFAARLPLIDADALLAVLDGTTGSGKTR